MKFAIIMNQNSYVGREYVAAMLKENICEFDVILIGGYKERDKIDDERTAGLWSPPQYEALKANGSFEDFHFSSLKDASLLRLLDEKQYDFGIQGGTGILSREHITRFRKGIINLHPGKLPEYRGKCAPEWQVYEGNPVCLSIHLITEGIDEGPVLAIVPLQLDRESYFHFRASIYPAIAQELVKFIRQLDDKLVNLDHTYLQDLTLAKFREVPSPEIFADLRGNWKSFMRSLTH